MFSIALILACLVSFYVGRYSGINTTTIRSGADLLDGMVDLNHILSRYGPSKCRVWDMLSGRYTKRRYHELVFIYSMIQECTKLEAKYKRLSDEREVPRAVMVGFKESRFKN